MSVTCCNGARDRHEIEDGARKITLPSVRVEWGTGDLRSDWTGSYDFCSFACLQEQAGEWAAKHDGAVLVEGEPA